MKGGDTMEFKYDSYCGLYCGACSVLAANKEGNVKEAAKKWDMNPGDIVCYGCKTETISVYCKDCDIKDCAEDRGVDFCFQCGNYPCNRLIEFNHDECPHHSVVMKNLETISKNGIEYWLNEQEKRWKCPECGTVFTWYDETCKNCGSTLYNCKDEEKDMGERT